MQPPPPPPPSAMQVLLNPWPGPEDRESWLCNTNCPSVTFAPNGTAIMAFKSAQCQRPIPPTEGTKEKIGIAIGLGLIPFVQRKLCLVGWCLTTGQLLW